MVEGASAGFTKELKIGGVGFRATLTGTNLSMTLGFSHPINYTIPAGIKVTVDAKQTGLVVQGADKERVGQVAAEIRRFRRPGVYWANNEPVGIRYTNGTCAPQSRQSRGRAHGRRGRSQEMSLKSPQERLAFRRLRARRKIFGTAEKPRLSVYRAQRHMYAQLVDDTAGRTLAAASSLLEDVKKP
jgi:hypothetical protein